MPWLQRKMSWVIWQSILPFTYDSTNDAGFQRYAVLHSRLFLKQINLFHVAVSTEIGLRRMRLSVRLWSSSGYLPQWVMRCAAVNSDQFYMHKIYFKTPSTRRSLGELAFLGNAVSIWPQKVRVVPVHVQYYLILCSDFSFPPSQQDHFLTLCIVLTLIP